MVGFLERYRLKNEDEYDEQDIDEVVDLLKRYSDEQFVPEGLIVVSHEIIEARPRLGIYLYFRILEHPSILAYIKTASQDSDPASDEEPSEPLAQAAEHEYVRAATMTKPDLMFR